MMGRYFILFCHAQQKRIEMTEYKDNQAERHTDWLPFYDDFVTTEKRQDIRGVAKYKKKLGSNRIGLLSRVIGAYI